MCFKYDIKFGLIKDFYKYIIIAAVTLFACVDYYINQAAGFELTQITPVLSDYLFYFFKGMRRFVPGEGSFQIPILWFTVQLYLAYIIGKYPKEDLYSSGINMLLKSRSRTKWWLSKCCWCVLTCVVYYAVIFAVILLFSAVSRTDILLIARHESMSELFLYAFSDESAKLVMALLLPLACSLSLSLLQMAVTFFTAPVYGFTAIAVLLISSAYFYTPLLPGNFSMLARSEIFMSGGIPLKEAYMCCGLIAAFSVLAGKIYFSRCDILGKE